MLDVLHRTNRGWVTLLRLGIGVTAVALLVRSTNVELTPLLDPKVWARIGVVVLLLLLAVALSALRWKLVLGPSAPTLRNLFRIYLIGWFFSLFLPTSVGGDAIRAT